MNIAHTLTPAQLIDFLLGLATVRPVFIWGAPGIGKSSLVREFAESLGLECVSLLGTQLAPEDLIGVPQIRDGRSVFCPPEAIARDEPYCLFLGELNAATPDVQKAFYSLILDRRIGDYELPKGSIARSPPSTPRPRRSTSTRCAASTTRSGGSSSPTRCCTPPCATATAAAPATRSSSTSPPTTSSTAGCARWT